LDLAFAVVKDAVPNEEKVRAAIAALEEAASCVGPVGLTHLDELRTALEEVIKENALVDSMYGCLRGGMLCDPVEEIDPTKINTEPLKLATQQVLMDDRDGLFNLLINNFIFLLVFLLSHHAPFIFFILFVLCHPPFEGGGPRSRVAANSRHQSERLEQCELAAAAQEPGAAPGVALHRSAERRSALRPLHLRHHPVREVR